MATAKMAKVRYTGPADIRTISKPEFGKVKVDAEGVRFDADNDFTQEVPEHVADYLLNDPRSTDFELVKDDETK